MTDQLIDLTQVDFWLVCLAAVIVLGPLTAPTARKYVLALVNLGFIGVILGWHAVGVFVAIPVTWLLVRAAGGQQQRLFLVLLGIGIAVLFVLNKLPALAASSGLSTLGGVLATIGYSYVALRAVDLVRAVGEQRYAPPDIASVVNYLLPFHMLAAGPIQSYDDFVQQSPVPEPLTLRATVEAFERIAAGLFKKFVLAYIIQEAFLTDFEAGGWYFLFEVQLFFLWLYLDFSAYSDIAVGIGRLLGVATPENFDRPYLARNAIDFWNRWHISLSQFVRRNIFIPLQLHLTRRSEGKRPLAAASAAFSVAFVLCGLWHGLTINFLLWGAIHAAGLVIANLWREYLKRRLGKQGVKDYMQDRRIKLAAHVITYEFVAFSLVVLFIP